MSLEELDNLLSNLRGTSEIIHFEEGLPIVFLIDEHHDNENNCIYSNIENALILIEQANVQIIGVESHSGGLKWDQYDQEYLEDEYYQNELVNTCPTFYNSMSNSEIFVHGIECWDILSKIECEISIQDNPYFGIEVTEHPLNIDRSKHFIKTLFELKEKNKINGNLILNCGSNHNTQIKEFVVNDEIFEITGYKASYVRLNTIG
jgi:hypothetical protein